MEKDFEKKLQKAKLHVDNFRSKVIRLWGLAKRLDQSHSKGEKRKKKQ